MHLNKILDARRMLERALNSINDAANSKIGRKNLERLECTIYVAVEYIGV